MSLTLLKQYCFCVLAAYKIFEITFAQDNLYMQEEFIMETGFLLLNVVKLQL